MVEKKGRLVSEEKLGEDRDSCRHTAQVAKHHCSLSRP